MTVVDTVTISTPPFGNHLLPVSQIADLLENVLFESPTLAAANAASWDDVSSMLASTASSAAAMVATPEASIPEEVIRLYQGILGRAPGAQEIAYYVGLIDSQSSATQISGGASAISPAVWDTVAGYFVNAPEFQSVGTDIVTALYQHVLARSPTAAELAYYADAMAEGVTSAQLVQYFVNSPEFMAKASPSPSDLLADYGAAVADDPSAPPTSLLPPIRPWKMASSSLSTRRMALKRSRWGRLLPAISHLTSVVCPQVRKVIAWRL